MVDVVNCFAPAKLVARGIERGGNAIVDALLPVARTWPAGGIPNRVRRWQSEWAEGRAVSDGVLPRLGVKGRGSGHDREQGREAPEFMCQRHRHQVGSLESESTPQMLVEVNQV